MPLPDDPSPSPDATPEAGDATATAALRALVRAARVLESACAGLSLSHYRVLVAVAGGDERASRVAARLALGKPAISVAVDSLCARGLLSRSGVPDDQRATCLRLTEEGTQLLGEVEAAMVARLTEVAHHAPDGPGLLGALGDLGTAVDRWRAESR